MRISEKNISFKSQWLADKNLIGQINNEKDLNELANVSKVDYIHTSACQNNKYLPSDNVYNTLSSKKVDGKLFYASDCIILSKDTPKDTLSESIFKSAQNAIGKLYGKIAKYNVENGIEQQTFQSKSACNATKSANIIKKLFNLFKKV